jgi:multicomponent Na+:H+ antiporter subunit G
MEEIVFWIREVGASLAYVMSIIFGLIGLVGLYRFPDAWSRLQTSSITSTTSILSMLLGTLIMSPNWEMAFRILIILGFFMISSPTGSHIIARFLWQKNIPHWKPEEGLKPGDNE